MFSSVDWSHADDAYSSTYLTKLFQSLTTTEEELHAHINDDKIDDCDTDKASLFYGKPEMQLLAGPEADLHKHYKSCIKNPEHKEFIPLAKFNISHLPRGYNEDIVELVKAIANLTVRVEVKMTSTERPEFIPNSKEPYAFYDIRGSSVTRLGTGMVFNVDFWTEGIFGSGPCVCKKCEHSDTPSKKWGKVYVWTATHVIFDEAEAKHTTCRFFYDREDSPLVTLGDWKITNNDIVGDRCKLKSVTCDVDLLEKLFNMWRRWTDNLRRAENKYKASKEKHRLTFIVSHPHGCPKQVSFGHWIYRYLDTNSWTKYTYTTCTCPGSSGACVQSLGICTDWTHKVQHVHSGVNAEGTNYSGVGWERPEF